MTPSALLPNPLEENLVAVRQRIAAAAASADRDPDDVQLLCVTKSVDVERTAALVRAGELDLGENRADAFADKVAALAALDEPDWPHPRWHFIGHLQRNKARRVAALADVIHSVDSERLLETLARLTDELGRRLSIYLQVDFTGEENKHGMDAASAERALSSAAAAAGLEVLGLMTMGPLVERPGHTTSECFAAAATLARRLEAEGPERFAGGRCGLSMGMSADLELAIAAGSTCVRVGGALFRPARAEPDGADGADGTNGADDEGDAP